jgi:prevent-host-death family protein
MNITSVTAAKARLAGLIRDADVDDVVIVRHGDPVAVLISARRHEALMEEVEDLRDQLSVYTARDEPTISAAKVKAELGLGV